MRDPIGQDMAMESAGEFVFSGDAVKEIHAGSGEPIGKSVCERGGRERGNGPVDEIEIGEIFLGVTELVVLGFETAGGWREGGGERSDFVEGGPELGGSDLGILSPTMNGGIDSPIQCATDEALDDASVLRNMIGGADDSSEIFPGFVEFSCVLKLDGFPDDEAGDATEVLNDREESFDIEIAGVDIECIGLMSSGEPELEGGFVFFDVFAGERRIMIPGGSEGIGEVGELLPVGDFLKFFGGEFVFDEGIAFVGNIALPEEGFHVERIGDERDLGEAVFAEEPGDEDHSQNQREEDQTSQGETAPVGGEILGGR